MVLDMDKVFLTLHASPAIPVYLYVRDRTEIVSSGESNLY